MRFISSSPGFASICDDYIRASSDVNMSRSEARAKGLRHVAGVDACEQLVIGWSAAKQR